MAAPVLVTEVRYVDFHRVVTLDKWSDDFSLSVAYCSRLLSFEFSDSLGSAINSLLESRAARVVDSTVT